MIYSAVGYGMAYGLTAEGIEVVLAGVMSSNDAKTPATHFLIRQSDGARR